MKLFKDDSLKKVEKEIEALRHLRGGPNIIEFIDAVQGDKGINIGLVLEFVDNIDFRRLYPRFDAMDIRYYIRELLKALQFTHSRGLIHCDVRPHNVVIDHQNRKLRLIGWSSYKVYLLEEEDYRICAPFKPPEVLLDMEYYDFRLDMWGVGSMLASMIFKEEPFFHGISLDDQLRKITQVLGTDALNECVERYTSEVWRPTVEPMSYCPPRAWSSLVKESNKHLVSDDAFDFVAEQALRHPYVQDLS
ncbi:hypothetical protein N0V84_009784 [Fusarium piperis]|uniref:EKC/KEOPS complex subunit BUD32 n=1 Tax=Fusarium piperis TaxID=1435070 RepID=A0A9W9BJJ1_9HYPO|nr:hypothetical protein N0V84_009784 [Fusarium piperis]